MVVVEEEGRRGVGEVGRQRLSCDAVNANRACRIAPRNERAGCGGGRDSVEGRVKRRQDERLVGRQRRAWAGRTRGGGGWTECRLRGGLELPRECHKLGGFGGVAAEAQTRHRPGDGEQRRRACCDEQIGPRDLLSCLQSACCSTQLLRRCSTPHPRTRRHYGSSSFACSMSGKP